MAVRRLMRRDTRGYALRYGGVAGIVLGAACIAALLQRAEPHADPAMIFLSGVLLAGALGGLGPSVVAALSSLVVYDFFFVDPRLTFAVTHTQDVFSLGVFFF